MVLSRREFATRLAILTGGLALFGLESCNRAGSAVPGLPATISPAPIPSNAIPATITAKLENPGFLIPPDLLGFSYEDLVLADDYFDINNSALINLLNNLGTGTLRFGGNNVEFTYWSRTARATFPSAKAILGPSDLDRLFAFSSTTGWRVIFELNLGADMPQMSADEASYASQVGARGELQVKSILDASFYFGCFRPFTKMVFAANKP